MAQEIPKINSLAVSLAREYILKNNQLEAVERFQALLSPEEKKLIFDPKGSIFTFVDEAMFFNILGKYDTFRHSVNLSGVLNVARFTGKNVTPKLWTGFLKNGDFAVIISGGGFAWRSMHTQGTVDVKITNATAAVITSIGGYKNPVHCEYIRGFILGMGDMFENIHTMVITEASCVFQGAQQCQYTISWIKK